MATKLFDKNLITLDGRMDEPVWEEVQGYTDFVMDTKWGGGRADVQTLFKFIPCQDRVYVGVKCFEPDMDYVTKINPSLAMWICDDIELFLAPSGDGFDFYQFAITFQGERAQLFYSERGNIQPDPYRPVWKSAVYKGEDYWSVEIELPLTAFYMTPADLWNETWLVNMTRTRCVYKNNTHLRMGSAWSKAALKNVDPENLRPIPGFPMRPAENDVRMYLAVADINEENEKGLCGTLTVKLTNPEDETFTFTTNYSQPTTVNLKKGDNVITVPCCFPKTGRYSVSLELTRLSDGMVFSRYYPVRIAYETIKLEFTKPGYRTDFFPGQDCSEILGKVTCAQPVTVKLEYPGLETREITPDADGTFRFDTTGMEVGEGLLTVTGAGKIITRKIRRLAPSDRMMTWLENGNLIVNGKPTFSRTVSAVGWHGGEALKRKYEADNLHETRETTYQVGRLQPDSILKGLGISVSETTRDQKPREEVYRKIDQVMQANQNTDFAFYELCDEPECRGVSPVYLKYLYDYVADKDPYHVIVICSRNAEEYIEVGDFFSTHPYINPYTDDAGNRVYLRHFSSLGKFVDVVAKLNRPDKAIKFLGTCFGAVSSQKDFYPTFDEYICNSWAGVIRGAKGLRQYAYHDINDRPVLYEATRYVFACVERLEDFLLFAKRTTLQRSNETECALYEYNGKKMFVLINFTQQPQQVFVEKLQGAWYNFCHGCTVSGPAFTLQPLEVLIGTDTVLDADMPTYQQTAERINTLEAKRLSNQSLLFERSKDVKVTTSGTIGSVRKLFDGVTDTWAWEQNKGDDKFYEVDVSKIKPTFNKVVISGHNIDNMTLRIRLDGKLYTPAISQVQVEEFATTFILKESATPQAIRLEFHKDNIELYEIEVFQM